MTLFQPEAVLQKIAAGDEFKQAELSRLRLESANIDRATFIECYMRGTIILDTSGKQANFKNTNLAFAKFEHADLGQANLERTELNSAGLFHSKE